jgi:hypothetical protein
MGETVVSVERVIKAPAASIFAILADPSRHPEIDGSGAVKKPKDDAPHNLTLGSKFGMSMKLGLPYSMSNTVIEFVQDKRIAWQTVFAGPLGRVVGGRIWRYDLDEAPGGTRVTETWDISKDKQRVFFKMGNVSKVTASSMTKSLERLAELTEPSAIWS